MMNQYMEDKNMVSNDEIASFIEECKRANHFITVRDIAYVILCRFFDDTDLSYKCLFGNTADYSKEYGETYDKTDDITYLKQFIDYTISKKEKRPKSHEDITFEENKAYMLKLKKDTENAMKEGKIDTKDGLMILKDLSVKLTDKFQIKDETVEQVVQVNTKFNSVCACGREIYIPTKEDLMKKYNLIEK